MNQNELIAQALEDLLAEVHRLQMADQVQKGMWTVLVRHLAASEALDLLALKRSIRLMSETQDNEDWKSLHSEYEDLIEILETPASIPR